MTRRWLISCSAFVVSTTFVAVAWSQGPSSLVERIQQLRRGWSVDEPTAEPSPITPSPRSAVPYGVTPAAVPQAAASSEKSGGLPQIDARSLFPTQLFSRPGAGDSSNARQPTTSSGERAASRAPAPTGRAAHTRMATPTRAGSVQANAAAAESFTLPGLGSSLSDPIRNATSAPERSSQAANRPAIAKSSARGNDTQRSSTASGGNIIGSAVSVSDDTAPVRRSPEQRAPVHFDPNSLRSELAGAFPSGSSETKESKPSGADEFTLTDIDVDEDAIKTPTLAADESDTPTPAEAEKPIALPVQSQPSSATAKRTPTESGPSITADDDRYQQNQISPLGPPPKPTSTLVKTADAGSAASSAGTGSSEAAARAFGSSSGASLPAKAADSSAAASRAFGTPAGRSGNYNRYVRSNDEERSETSDGPAPAVLATNQAPVITSDIRGPQQITIGREATYRLRLKNQGAVSAEGIVATVHVPSWADIVATSATHGSVRQGDAADGSVSLEWEIPPLDAHGTETLSVTLIPRTSRPLELGITWTYAPVDSRAVVEVQEPKLRMLVSGPDEVLFGKPHIYRLTMSNPGTGVAEDVHIKLVPPGGTGDTASTHRFGDLPPGESRTVEVELIAREAGKLSVTALATAAGGLRSEANKELFCRKPELEVDWRGPEMQYANTPATYFFRVRNPGTAAADNVAVRVTLPAGAEFVSGSEGCVTDAVHREVAWRVGTLGPGDDCYMELRCVVQKPGENELRVAAATAEGDLTDEKVAMTDVVALADLTLDVTDPPGPVLVGEEAVYEIRIENRGSSAAEDVDVVGLFSTGLDPETVEGAPYTSADGRVAFRPIRRIPAGQKILLQIRARATKPGTHVFRAEVLCRDLEIKLAAEETTRFYENDTPASHPMTPSATLGTGDTRPVR